MADTYDTSNASKRLSGTNSSNSLIASAIALPEDEIDPANHVNGVKRRMSESPEGEKDTKQEHKRQRISPGKNSPEETGDTDATSNLTASDNKEIEEKPEDPREARRKSGVADEKQRSKRLFGALLGSLNQPRDRTSKRRQEIESRRKAELQRQDDERVEDKQRRQDRLAERRKKAQVKVEEENMRTRHSNMLNRANYLQTVSEPRIFYKPWDLRPDEEDRIRDQIRDVQAQIDKELDELDERYRRHETPVDTRAPPEATKTDGDSETTSGAAIEDQTGEVDSKNASNEDETADKSTDEAAKPAEVPESPIDMDTNLSFPQHAQKTLVEPQKGKEDVLEDDGVHVEGGDEDSVIY